MQRKHQADQVKALIGDRQCLPAPFQHLHRFPTELAGRLHLGRLNFNARRPGAQLGKFMGESPCARAHVQDVLA